MYSQRFQNNESERLRELHALAILDTPDELVFDNLTQLACEICETPVALISLVDAERTWFKSRVGYFEMEVRRCDSFCSHVIEHPIPLVIEDASLHPTYRNNVHVVSVAGVRSYVGVPLITSKGLAVGVICAQDRKPRTFTNRQVVSLTRLANLVVSLLEQRRMQIQTAELQQRSDESEKRLGFALDAAGIGDWSMDLRTNIAVRSLQHDRCFGYEQAVAEWGHDTFLQHVDPRDRERVDKCFQEALAGKANYDVEFRTTWPDGSLHWLWSKGRCYFDAGGVVCRVAGIQADITARVIAERELSESNHHYQLLFEKSVRALLLTGVSGEVLFANPAACALFGLTQEQIRVRGRAGLVDNKDPRLADLLAQRTTSGSTQGQLRMLKGDGSVFEAEISSNVYADHAGEFKTSMMITDVTEKMRLLALERAQHSEIESLESHHLGLLQNLSSGIVVHGPDTRITFSNTSASDLLGLSMEQMHGKAAMDPRWTFVYEDGNAVPIESYPVNQVIASLLPLKDMVLGVRRPDKADLVWLLVHAFPERDETGQLKQVVVNFNDITKLKSAEAEKWNEANFDHLTQLPNRRLFHDRLEQKLRESQRDNTIDALMILDLDHFKDINDTLGHRIGDLLLVEAAHRIKECVRDSDTLARLGGDEFAVLLSDLRDGLSIGQIASKLLHTLASAFQLEGQEVVTSGSIGIAIYPADGVSAADLLKHADQALYAAKSAGRNVFRYFAHSMQISAEYRMSLMVDLRHALQDNQLEVHYQPIVDLLTGRIEKAEALLRWKHPKHGFVGPALFIPIAEESGIIHEIGNWVFHEAANQVAALTDLKPGFQISVNKSPVQFAVDDGLQRNWVAHLNDLGLPGSSIVVEITEGLLMNANISVNDRLLQLRDAGIQVAIDDFGTGYSSLAYLKKFHIDFLKIDQSFIRNLTPLSVDLAVCEAIIVMAHKLGLQVIAEGVETQEQLDLLKQMDCDYGQGYLFARPMPKAELEILLAQA